MCAKHEVLERCLVCQLPRAASAAGWTWPSRGFARCPACSVGAVDRQVEARRHLPAVRRDLAALGLRLQRPVRVELADLTALSDGQTGRHVLGQTQLRQQPGGALRHAILITVVAGLDPLLFGAVIAHEATHAWLGETGVRAAEPQTEEGLCELFAAAWLKRQRAPFADALRTAVRENADPVYGDGFRAVHAAVRSCGLAEVIESVRRTGRLPCAAR